MGSTCASGIGRAGRDEADRPSRSCWASWLWPRWRSGPACRRRRRARISSSRASPPSRHSRRWDSPPPSPSPCATPERAPPAASESSGGPICWPTALPTVPVAGLDAGATTVVNLPYTFPRTGIFLSFATVDVTNAVAETNEGNNVVPKAFTPSLGVDLVVSSVSIDPATPAPGQPVTVSMTVANQGANPAGAFRVDWSSVVRRSRRSSARWPGSPADASTTVTIPYAYLERRHLRQPRGRGRRQHRPGDERVQQREVVEG